MMLFIDLTMTESVYGKWLFFRTLLLSFGFTFFVTASGLKALPIVFILGDSLVDSGNNNYFYSVAAANFQPYGLDRPDRRATGRFSNNRTVGDLLKVCNANVSGEAMGTEPVLPVLDPACHGSELLRGVNFASAGAGLHPHSGDRFVNVLTLETQLEHYKKVKAAILSMLGDDEGRKRIAGAVHLYCVGGNDYINNYLQPDSTTKFVHNPAQWQDLLISIYKAHLQTHYELGARKFILFNLPAIGCIPQQLATNLSETECIDSAQEMAANFNAALKSMVEDLTTGLESSQFVYVNSFGIVLSIIENGPQYGFTNTRSACCGGGEYNGQKGCNSVAPNFCPDRRKYAWFDGFHPTDALNVLITERMLNGSKSDVSPMNVKDFLGL